jgi:preprotein translocase subunit YajC
MVAAGENRKYVKSRGGAMNRIFKIGLIAGLLLAVLVLVGSCATTTGTQTTNQSSTTSTLYLVGFLVVIFALFYFVMIRPQRKRQKEQQNMISTLQKGDRVITAGGIYGVIDNIREDSVIIKVEGGTLLRVAKGSIMVLKDQVQQTK